MFSLIGRYIVHAAISWSGSLLWIDIMMGKCSTDTLDLYPFAWYIQPEPAAGTRSFKWPFMLDEWGVIWNVSNCSLKLSTHILHDIKGWFKRSQGVHTLFKTACPPSSPQMSPCLRMVGFPQGDYTSCPGVAEGIEHRCAPCCTSLCPVSGWGRGAKTGQLE